MSLTPMRNPNRYDDADHSWNNSLAGVRTTHPRPVCLVALTPRAWDVLVDAVRNHAENASADDTGGDSGGQPAADLLPVEPVAHPSDLLALQPEDPLVHVLLPVVHLPELCFVPAGRLLHALLERLVAREDDLS